MTGALHIRRVVGAAVTFLFNGGDLQLRGLERAGVSSTTSTVSSGIASVPTRIFGVGVASLVIRPPTRSSTAARSNDRASSSAAGSMS